MADPKAKGHRLNGIGDEAWAWPTNVYMRKQSAVFNITVGRRDMDEQKALEQGKQLAQKAATRMK